MYVRLKTQGKIFSYVYENNNIAHIYDRKQQHGSCKSNSRDANQMQASFRTQPFYVNRIIGKNDRIQ
jgi:hypothetical protein